LFNSGPSQYAAAVRTRQLIPRVVHAMKPSIGRGAHMWAASLASQSSPESSAFVNAD
jgi:hypothetical protein